MGAGASSPEADQHLRKWDNAVNDLQQLCNDQRRAMGLPARERHAEERTTTTTAPSAKDGKTPPHAGAVSPGTVEVEKTGDGQPTFRRRTSSLVSFGSGQRGPVSPSGAGEAAGGGVSEGGGRPRVPTVLAEPEKLDTPRGGGGVPMSPANKEGRTRGLPTEFSPGARESSTQPTHRSVTREQVTTIKKNRIDLYKSYHTTDDLDDIEGQHACSHFAVVAAGLSAVMGGQLGETDRKKKVTVEDLFFAAQIPLQALHSDTASMTELFDVVREFVDVDNRFKDQFIVECVHLDIAPAVGTVEAEGNEVGDRQTRVQLPELRKQIQTDIEEDEHSVRFVYYDPFIVHRALTQDDDDDEEGDVAGASTNNADLLSSISSKPKGGAQKANSSRGNHSKPGRGALAAIADFRNAVQPMVTLVHAAATDRVHTLSEELPLTHVYKAMHAVMDAGRAGGYIRVTKKKSDTSTDGGSVSAAMLKDEVDSFFSAELCSGKVLGSKMDGTDAHVTDDRISRHIGACAWALHFLGGANPANHNHGNGLPISKIIRELKLPIDVFNRCDLSLDQVYVYLQQYLNVTGKDQTLSTTLCPVLTKNHRPDAPPSLSVFEFEAALLNIKGINDDPENPTSIMILQYNANIAHNVIEVSRKSQWCVLAGYDEDLQLAKLIDPNALRFSASWTVSLESLHKAITNYGYITLKKKGVRSGRGSLAGSTNSNTKTSADGSRSPELGGLRSVNSTLQAHFDLLGSQVPNFPISDVIEYFVFPEDVMSVTQIPIVLRRLGAVGVTVENALHWLPFDINALMKRTLSLHTMSLLFSTFASLYNDRIQEAATKDGGAAVPEFHVDVEVKHADRNQNEKSMLLSDFSSALAEWTENQTTSALLLNFSADHLDIFGTCNPSGEYGVVTAYNKDKQIVTVADVNSNRFFRTWKVGLVEMYNAMYHPSPTFRSRGFLVVNKVEKLFKSSTGGKKEGVLSRPCDLTLVPLQNLFSVSPSPQIQALSFAFAMLGHPFSPEEIFYEAYLKTLTDQRRRGSQAYAWRDVEVTLNTVNKVTAEICQKVAKKFLDSRKVTTLSAEVVDDTEEEDFLAILTEGDAFGPNPDCIYLANYNTEIVHGVTGMGNSMCVIESYDPNTKMIGLFEAEHSQFGLRWSTDVDIFIQACDLECEGKSDLGLVKVFTKDPAISQGGKVGTGFTDISPDPAGPSSTNSPAGVGRRGGGRAVFVEQ